MRSGEPSDIATAPAASTAIAGYMSLVPKLELSGSGLDSETPYCPLSLGRGEHQQSTIKEKHSAGIRTTWQLEG